MKFIFNIIYTPGTVAYFNPLRASLLHWSDCSFRLVSNACLPPEQRFLQKLAAGHPSLEFWALPAQKVWPHGQVLNYLHALTREEYFGFLDSDIFATGEFLPYLVPSLSSYTALFSAAPVWAKTSDQIAPGHFKLFSGPHNRTNTGQHIGSSYFALYDQQIITDLISNEGIGFDEFRWDAVPSKWREPLTRLGLAKQSYDTGKLLNAILIAQGHSLLYTDVPNLFHLGGTSFVPLTPSAPRWWDGLPGISVLRRWRAGWGLHRRFTKTHIEQTEIRAEAKLRLDQRNVVRQYFWQLLQALHTHQPHPTIPATGDLEIQARLEKAAIALIDTHQQFATYQATRTTIFQKPLEQ